MTKASPSEGHDLAQAPISLLAPFASERFGSVNGAARGLLRELGEWT